MIEPDQNHLTEIFADELWQVMIMNGMLENNQIQTFVENESMGVISAWHVTAGGVNPIKLLVL